MHEPNRGELFAHIHVLLDGCAFRATPNVDGTTTLDIDGGAIAGLTAILTPQALDAMREAIKPPRHVESGSS
ncbi:hypothetical protein [Kibdelosporangium phytohabitans]|uniref:Uncharacterized protein n=1 Tax=Kibdelosporangium phytohabitans TaxID=860235 RepID=A0A0N7F2U5_9PSEU|nr:hypothetical protein [Kibdelosporangium phytohabitans]ALG06807.1 hypothetical protein AOZ06_07595 [Kibdelosporangium phytohabitans]MBE1468048.1 hypothetical protein [Kibdelosporangium phytohabitans]